MTLSIKLVNNITPPDPQAGTPSSFARGNNYISLTICDSCESSSSPNASGTANGTAPEVSTRVNVDGATARMVAH